MAPIPATWQHPLAASKYASVPGDREGQLHTQVFERYQCYEPHIALVLTRMFVAGVSTHKPGEVGQTLLGAVGSRQYHRPLTLSQHMAAAP